MSSWMHVNASYRDTLARAGLVSFDDWMGAARDAERDAGRRETFTTFALDVAGGFRVYLKRFRPAGPSPRFVLRHSRQRREAESAWMLAALDVPTAEVVAAGERRCCTCVTAAFVATREIPGAVPMPEFVETRPTRARRRALVAALARIVRRMHDGGYVDHDLRFRNILVTTTDDGAGVHLIDSPRGGRPRCRVRWAKRRDLATLNEDARTLASRTERLRFVLTYLGTDRLGRVGRRLCRRVENLTDRIVRRGRR
ncbi:MAG TPA: lipopolysaccharide kinase InaA family protein [Planctomycetota bacterium]|nr:lipopolysaccharide kinase InaA family protein [Planctomycetota bacterium]